jgi:hypothetical protein
VEIPGVPSNWQGRSLGRFDVRRRTNMWGLIGNYLNGWAKFALAVAAAGWFGLQVADRYAPRSATVTLGHAEVAAPRAAPDVVQTAADEHRVANADAPAADSVFSELVQEFVLAVRELAANTLAQLAAVLIVGVTGGLAIRPKVNQWREGRAVRAARRRADRNAADLRLLAAFAAKSNVPGPSASAVQPMKRH